MRKAMLCLTQAVSRSDSLLLPFLRPRWPYWENVKLETLVIYRACGREFSDDDES
jgi:hypothetical protein